MTIVHRPFLQYVLLAFFLFFLFAWYQAPPTFPDPDSFYHTKMALLLKERGAAISFPALPFTTLQDAWADHHFLYHVFLIPFLSFFPPFVGMKIATVVFATIALLTIFFFLREERVEGAIWYVVLLSVLQPFAFRMSLAKAPAVALVLILLTLFFLFRRSPIPLFFLAWIFVLTYGGWPILFIFLGAAWFGKIIHALILRVSWIRALRSLFLPSVALFGGGASGLLTHPSFPEIFSFLRTQVVDIAFVNYRGVIQVGSEWYGYTLSHLIAATPLVFALLMVSCILLFLTFREQDWQSWTLFFLTGFFLLATIASRRYVEYFIPFSVFWSARMLTGHCSPVVLRIRQSLLFVLRSFKKKSPLVFASFAVYFFLTISFLFGRDVYLTRTSMENGFSLVRLSGVSQWLSQRVPRGSVIVHSNWSDFPMLFLWNSDLKYIAGLDPTFFYLKNRDQYRTWESIIKGVFSGDLAATIRNTFQSKTVVVAKSRLAMHRLFERDRRFVRVYEDDDAWVYQLP